MNSNIKKLFIVLLSAILLQSCAEEDSEPNIPGSDRDKFVGTWLCHETFAGSPPTTFSIEIVKHGSEDTLFVYNFSNIGAPFHATWLVSGNGVVIPGQNISQTTFSGSGVYSGGEISLTYTSDGESVSADCTR